MASFFWSSVFLLGFLSFILGTSSQGVCPKNWIYLQGSCYMMSSKTLNWNAAKAACETLGSTLALVTSKAEQQALTAKVPGDTWIGLHRDPKDTSRWLWVDGTTPSYTSWTDGEPNDTGGVEACGHMWSKGLWNDHQCSTQLYYVCEKKARCPNLSLESGVFVSPSHCASSPQTQGSKCVFSCARGYHDQVNGPSSAHCGGGGVWNQQSNKVSCHDVDECAKQNAGCSHTCVNTVGGFKCECPDPGLGLSADNKTCQDVDECAKQNAGCSHTCVNTVGGFKCECPDPGLSLSADNKTCQVHGVTVACGDKNMTITIPKFQFPGLDRDHLQLLDTTCKAIETTAHFSFATPLTGCNTSSKHTPTAVVYSNKVVGITMLPKHNITRGRELEISFSCFYSKGGVASSVSFKPSDRKLVFSDEGHGNFTLTLDMFPDNEFTNAYTNDDYPVAVLLRKRLFFEVSVTLGDKQLSVKADQCYATASQNGKSHLKYEFIKAGCPTDETVKYHSAPAVSAQRFSMEAFKFIANHSFVFVHCHVIICNATNPGSLCAKKCPPSSRGRRDVSDHLNEKYTLAQGPIFIGKAKEEEKGDTSIERGSSPTLLVALSVMCVAGFAGMALIAYKRSHDKPAGYTSLTSDLQD